MIDYGFGEVECPDNASKRPKNISLIRISFVRPLTEPRLISGN